MFRFYSNYLYCPPLFGFGIHLSPSLNHSFVTVSLIYKGIRLYSRVTNLGPEGEQTLHFWRLLSRIDINTYDGRLRYRH